MNGELWGRVTSMSLGVVFEGADDQPRHPVQLYEAFFEGPVLAFLLFIFHRRNLLRSPFMISCYYLLCYSLCRFMTEFFREADAMVGYFYGFTRGQLLCAVYIFISMLFIKKLRRRQEFF